jgi:RNA polymerase sigma-70 factor (ECF subfamily)
VTGTPRTKHNDPEVRTLGDLLYADRTQKVLAEAGWVALVQSIADGDQRALQALYERSHRIVFTLMMRITNSWESAEELTLDVFHDVWRRASKYDPENGSVVGWMMNQARSRALDRLRFEHRKKRVDAHPETAPPPATASDPYDELQLTDRDRLMRAALTVLTADERQAIETAFFSELTYAEAAARLNQPLGTVKTRIRTGLAKLRHALAAAGQEP